VLALDNVTVGYGRASVLHRVSLRVNPGEIIALVGANGAGKSTTLRAISGVLKPTTGSILLDGKSIGSLSPERIAALGIAHVPEGRRVFPAFTVRENLEIAGLALGRPAQEIEEDVKGVMKLFPRLEERQGQYGWSLSGGEQQMLVIGRGLVARPKLLMLDEPSLGLAPNLVDQLFDVIEEIRERGTTDPVGGAERQHGPCRGGPRLRPGVRHHHPAGIGGGSVQQRSGPRLLPGHGHRRADLTAPVCHSERPAGHEESPVDVVPGDSSALRRLRMTIRGAASGRQVRRAPQGNKHWLAGTASAWSEELATLPAPEPVARRCTQCFPCPPWSRASAPGSARGLAARR